MCEPIKLHDNLVRVLTADLLVDSLASLGAGMPSDYEEQNWIMVRLHKVLQELFDPENEQPINLDKATVERALQRPPRVPMNKDLTREEMVGLMARSVACLPEMGEKAVSQEHRWAGACRASWSLREGMERRANLNTWASFVQVVREKVLEKCEPAWNTGLSPEDVYCSLIAELLSPPQILEDYKCWESWLAECSPSAILHGHDSARVGALNKLRNIVDKRSQTRRGEILATLASLKALREMEHELLRDTGIDSSAANLWCPRHHSIGLGLRGQLQLGQPFQVFHDHTLGVMPEDAEQQIHNPAPFRFWFRPEYGPLAGSRALIVWRGGAYSAKTASEALPRICRAAVRTASLALFGNRARLGYLVDPWHCESDAEYRGAGVDAIGTEICNDIKKFPPSFTIANWLEFVHGQFCGGNAGVPPGPSMAARAVLLLNEADELLRANPRLSFLCSMTALESCFCSSSEMVSDRLSKRIARLLVSDQTLRGAARMELVRLYGIRSKVAHGDMVNVEARHAVFMRYVASCAVFQFAGFGWATGALRLPAEANDLQQLLDRNEYAEGAFPGVEPSPFLEELLQDESELRLWSL